MSKHALFYYAENLPLIQKATFQTGTKPPRGIGENGRDLLVFLCDGANEKQNWTFYFSHRYISEETGIHIANVKRLMAGFEQLGWITRTGQLIRHQGRGAPQVEYALTFYPPCAEIMRTGSQTGSHVATDNHGKTNTAKDTPAKLETETEPKPETEPEPATALQAGKGGKEWGVFHDEVLRECLAYERTHFTGIDKGGLAKRWEQDYRPIVATAISSSPSAGLHDQVQWCVTQRQALRGKQVPLPAKPVPVPASGVAGCPDCDGDGMVQEWQEETKTYRSLWCHCTGKATHPPTQEPTTERVNTGEETNTDIPSPVAQADPQLRDLKAVTGKLFRATG